MNINPDSQSNPTQSIPNQTPETKRPNETEATQRSSLNAYFSAIRSQPGRLRGYFSSLMKGHHGAYQPLKSAPSYSMEKAPPIKREDKLQLAVDAELAAYPYHRSLKKIESAAANNTDTTVAENTSIGSWDTARPLALAAGKATGLKTKGTEGFIYDKKSGLTAYLLHNPKTKEIRLVFGGTTSGKKTGGMVKRSGLNRMFTLRQWIANGKNALLGKAPDSFHQASLLTKKVQILVNSDPLYAGYSLTLSGHSKGGAEASYAALTQKSPLKAICFSSAELGRETRNTVINSGIDLTKTDITHYNIKGDVIPNAGRVLGAIGHIGTVITIPAKNSRQGPIDRHDKFTDQINYFAHGKPVDK